MKTIKITYTPKEETFYREFNVSSDDNVLDTYGALQSAIKVIEDKAIKLGQEIGITSDEIDDFLKRRKLSELN